MSSTILFSDALPWIFIISYFRFVLKRAHAGTSPLFSSPTDFRLGERRYYRFSGYHWCRLCIAYVEHLWLFLLASIYRTKWRDQPNVSTDRQLNCSLNWVSTQTIEKCVCPKCVLSPFLFRLYNVATQRELEFLSGFIIGGHNPSNVCYCFHGKYMKNV